MPTTLSVVIPCHNSASTLRRALESVLMQGVPDLDIIVVDDGSTDQSLEIVKDFPTIRAISQAHSGPAATRNRGVAEARGSWIAFLDADDEWMPGKLAAQLAAQRTYASAAVHSTNHVRVRADGSSNLERRRHPDLPILHELLESSFVGTPTVMVRRDCLEECGSFDPQLRTGEDWDLWLRLSARYEWRHLDVPFVACYTSHSRKMDLDALDLATRRTLGKLADDAVVRACWPEVIDAIGLVRSWHLSIVGKSFIRAGELRRGLLTLHEAVQNDGRAWEYLIWRVREPGIARALFAGSGGVPEVQAAFS